MIFGLGIWELALLLGAFIALFGLGRVPQVARELGRLYGLIERVRGFLRNPFRLF